MKEKKKINTILNIVIVVLLISLLAFSFFYIKSNLSFNKNNVDVSFLGSNDASGDTSVAPNVVFNSFSDDKYSLILSEDGIYTLSSKSDNAKAHSFSGGYIYKTGQDVFDIVSEEDIKNSGLNTEKINLNNLFVIKAEYGEHDIPGGSEYYNKEIHDMKDPAFYFMIYFKDNGKTVYTAIHPLSDLNAINFENSYF